METNSFKWNSELTHAMVKFYADATVADARVFNHEYASHELTYRELLYIYTIATTENCSAKDLVAQFGVSKSMVSQMISRLEEKKLIIRTKDDVDSRINRITLSPESVDEFSKKIRYVDQAVERLGGKFSEQELNTAARVMVELSSYMAETGCDGHRQASAPASEPTARPTQ